MAETGLHGMNGYQSKAKESALLFVPRVTIVFYSHLGRVDTHRGQREAGTASGSRPQQAAGTVILKIIQWPVQGAVRYGVLVRWPEQPIHL